jgi:cell division septal protein FtsQ
LPKQIRRETNAGELCRHLEDQRSSFLYVQRGIKLIPQPEALDVQYQVIRNGEGLERKVKDAVRMMNALKQPIAYRSQRILPYDSLRML